MIEEALAFLTLLANIAFILVLAEIIMFKTRTKVHLSRVSEFLGKHAVLLAFIISLGSVIGSLYFSEIAGLEPCTLCWYQRIFIYPLAFIFGTALIRKNKGTIFRYATPLAFIGGIIAIYHYLLQRGITDAAPCPALGSSTDCALLLSMHYGYITIPMMSITAFALIVTLAYLNKKVLA